MFIHAFVVLDPQVYVDILLLPCYTKEKEVIHMTANYTNWETEFVDAKFVDQRLKTRFFRIMDAFAAAPDKST